MSEFNEKVDLMKMLRDGRVLYPLTDLNGDLSGVAGWKKEPGNPVYSVWGAGFYGNVKTEKDTLIFTEGVAEVQQAQRNGYDHVIGIMAVDLDALFSEGVLKQIAEMKKNVILSFGQDNMGKEAADRLARRMRAAGIPVSIHVYQPGNPKDQLGFLNR